MTSVEISRKYPISRQSIQYRAKMLGIKSTKRVTRFFTPEEVDKIVNYTYKKHNIDTRAFHENKIQIIEMYLNSKNNSCTQIADTLNLSWHYVSRVVNEWLENDKTITVASKI